MKTIDIKHLLLGFALGTTVLLGVAVSVFLLGQNQRYQYQPISDFGSLALPPTVFDTQTGDLFRLHHDTNNPSMGSYWKLDLEIK